MINMLTLEESHNLYRQTHTKFPSNFKGFSLHKWIPDIGMLIKTSNIKTVLDFGCGKAGCWNQYDLKGLWGLTEVALYDPGVESYNKLPEKRFDLVICTDVLEHVPEHLLNEVLTQITTRARKAVFCTISTRPASKTLVDGSNAHANVQNESWWRNKLIKYNPIIISHFD